ncbi:hypothetical protein psyc5s11_17220 [Clostridium gelidum]|uniref:Uncharacterized protein n=1 Tax=Clostridium gelidum TaxID=704125 RepID=A0ABM7T3C9_9CLOT|nr:hypothetical protein [Clostridium gelidum]BCZ45655.1 hypothetical protein psyc5s11_17220 [Clostridium gelidum]
MKRFTALFLIFFSLTFNIIGLKSVFAITNTFTQGIYKSSDLIPSKSNVYSFSNISLTDGVYLIILDENQVINHAIRLQPNSGKHITVPILTNYRIVILGKGELYFTPIET